jgi:hypothetical protein
VGAANVSLIDRADIQRVRLNTEPALSSVPLAGPVRAPGKCRTLRDMNREGAETFLRLLAETKLRDQLAPDPPPWAGGPGAGRVKVHVVGQALTAVGALDRETVEDVLADFDLAVSLRRLHGPGSSGPAGFMRAAVADHRGQRPRRHQITIRIRGQPTGSCRSAWPSRFTRAA